MPARIAQLSIVPLEDGLRKQTDLGAEVRLPDSMRLLDPGSLSDQEISNLRDGLFQHGLLVVRDQSGVDPNVLVNLAKLFDPTAKDIHSGGLKQVTDEKNILSQNNCSRIPRAPQVTVIGKGNTAGHEGIDDLEMKHLDHTVFHETPLSDRQIEAGFTRPYRWHMDAPVYENLPGVATVLHSIEAPDLPDQRIYFPSGDTMPIAAGATAFFSGSKSFELLSDDQKQFALHTTVNYAPRAYEWMKDCKATDDGLTIANVGREKPEHELEPFDREKVHSYPMVWKIPATGRPHLQFLGCCVQSLTTRDTASGEFSTIDDLSDVRRICHDMQSRVYMPLYVYGHRWKHGDLVIFHNRGVISFSAHKF